MMAEGENISMIEQHTEQSNGSWRRASIALANDPRSPLGVAADQRMSTEEALGTSDTNGCENKCEHNREHNSIHTFCCQWVNISPICFSDSMEKCVFSISLSAEYTSRKDFLFQGLAFSVGFLFSELTLNVWNCESNLNSWCVGSVLWFHLFPHRPFSTLSKSPTLFLLQFPVSWQTWVGSWCSASSATLEVCTYLFFMVCTSQELKIFSRKWRRLVVERQCLFVKTNCPSVHMAPKDMFEWRGMSYLKGGKKSYSHFMKGVWKTPTRQSQWLRPKLKILQNQHKKQRVCVTLTGTISQRRNDLRLRRRCAC